MNLLPSDIPRIVVQGGTGREARMVIRHMVGYGTDVHACVTPGRGGETVEGIRVFDTIDAASEAQGGAYDVALASVPPVAACDAVAEAIDASIPLIVVPTENIPLHDLMRMLARTATSGSVIIGPNSVGLISPGRRLKIGAIGGDNPDRSFVPGNVGVISRSGGLTSEVGLQLRLAGLGVSTAVSVGGDAMIGTTPADLYSWFVGDPYTRVVVYVGEPGSTLEDRFAERIEAHGGHTPVVGLIPGRFMDRFPSGATFGHAGAVIRGTNDSAEAKVRRLLEAGATVVETFAELIDVVVDIAGALENARP